MAPSLPYSSAAPAASPGMKSLLWLELSLCLGEGAVTPLYRWMKAIRLVCVRKEKRRSEEVSVHTFAVQGHCSSKP